MHFERRKKDESTSAVTKQTLFGILNKMEGALCNFDDSSQNLTKEKNS